MNLRKDASLARLSEFGNVAQFVAFEPTNRAAIQTFSRVCGYETDHTFADIAEAASALISFSSEQTVNIRSYTPDSPRSREFIYGISDASQAAETGRRLLGEGLNVILNETIDVSDGGVSGVLQGDVIEFAPDDTPRCVEKPGVVSLSSDDGLRLIEAVYGFRPDLPKGGRTEFSVHPRPRGWRHSHTLLWEHEDNLPSATAPTYHWPNRFSRHIGDKAYGLLMANLQGIAVPRTTVVSRRVAPFTFGRATGSLEIWTRTCPREQEPGLFTTVRGWVDPFRLLALEDPEGNRIASIVAQAAVNSQFSGAALVDAEGRRVIEGVSGTGEMFMLGERTPEPLPQNIVDDVIALQNRAAATFGPVRMEWAHDGVQAWILQLHIGATQSTAMELVPGVRAKWIEFDVSHGLDELRRVLASVEDDEGIVLRGRIGLTSHIADLLRKSGIPTKVDGGL